MSRPASRASRGAAAVETALCMLVIIPVFLYALFVDDMLRHALDAQEAALSTVWDYSVQDYSPEAGTGYDAVQGYARLMFCDHESGADSFRMEMGPGKNPGDPPRETAHECHNHAEEHHVGVAAHVCWLNKGAEQVRCQQPDKSVGAFGVPLHSEYMNRFSQGGLIRCSARAGIQNFLLPQQFLPEFSKVQLAKERKDRDEGGIHQHAQSTNAEGHDADLDVYLLPEERLAILTDTWALRTPASIRPGTKSGPLYDRVAQVYRDPQNVGHPLMDVAVTALLARATSSNLLNPQLALDRNAADDPATPNIAISPHAAGSQTPSERVQQEGRSRYYFNTEWRDWEQDNNQETYRNRGDWYLGCSRAEGC